MKQIEAILSHNGISPTPVRMLVYRCILEAASPVSLSDIETSLDTVDKSTISRTLSTFRNRHLIHALNDGSGSVKYEACKSPGTHNHDDVHVHFHCNECGDTICLHQIPVPAVDLPDGYVAEETNYVISGKCHKCSEKR